MCQVLREITGRVLDVHSRPSRTDMGKTCLCFIVIYVPGIEGDNWQSPGPKLSRPFRTDVG